MARRPARRAGARSALGGRPARSCGRASSPAAPGSTRNRPSPTCETATSGFATRPSWSSGSSATSTTSSSCFRCSTALGRRTCGARRPGEPADSPDLDAEPSPSARRRSKLARPRWAAFRSRDPGAVGSRDRGGHRRTPVPRGRSHPAPRAVPRRRRRPVAHRADDPRGGRGRIARTRGEAFADQAEREERPFMGDSSLRLHLDRLLGGRVPLLDRAGRPRADGRRGGGSGGRRRFGSAERNRPLARRRPPPGRRDAPGAGTRGPGGSCVRREAPPSRSRAR